MEKKYKDSGIPWIGQIPEHWEVKFLRAFLNPTSEKGKPELPLLSVTRDKGIILRGERGEDDNNNVIPEDLSNYKIVQKGDFVINKMKSWQGSYGLSKFNGIVSPAYYTYRLNFPNKDFFSIALRSKAYIPFFELYSKGIRVDQWDLKPNAIKVIPFLVPPVEEQERIAAYLDRKCGEIDELIEIEKQMISDLEAYRQAVITEAVTHGLNPNVPTKDTSIQGVGNIPLTWNEVRFKSVFTTRKGLSITKADLVESGIPVINYGQIHSKHNKGTTVSSDILKYIPAKYISTDKHSLVRKGDFIFADTSEDIEGCGNCAYIDIDGDIFAGYHTIIVSGNNIDKYFAYLFLTDAWRSQIRSRVTGIKVFSISQSILSETKIILPPLKEQQEIADYLDDKCAEIDDLIKVKQEKIETLKQYRQSLIFEAVTGKAHLS